MHIDKKKKIETVEHGIYTSLMRMFLYLNYCKTYLKGVPLHYCIKYLTLNFIQNFSVSQLNL